MITRRRASLAVGSALLVAHRLSSAATAVTMRRVGFLSIRSEAAGAELRAAFTQGMRELGWVEGKNVEYRFAYAEGNESRLESLANELVAQKVDVIVSGGAPQTRAAQRATKTIPIVMAAGPNPAGNGFVASLAHPGGNTTGITTQQEVVLGKLIEILHEVTPLSRRIAIVLNEGNPSHAEYWSVAQSACAALKLDAQLIVASVLAQLESAVEQIVQQRSQAIVVVADAMYLAQGARLQELMQSTKLPVAYGWREHVAAGGLFSYAADLPASFRYAAKWVDKILKGAKPADLPVEQSTKFELVFNLKTAKALGLTIPQSLLFRADEVISEMHPLVNDPVVADQTGLAVWRR